MNHKDMITCPKCGEKQEWVIWDTINTEREPEMKDKVRSGEVIRFQCAHCGTKSLLNYSFLYEDMDLHHMIYLCVDDTSEEGMRGAFSNLISQQEKRRETMGKREDDFTCRIVHSYNELMEKLFIAEAGFDDRIVEIIKSALWKQVEKDHKELEIDEILFTITSEDRTPGLLFRSQGAMVTSMVFDQPLYEAIKENALSTIQSLSAHDFVIDRAWAEDMVEKLG